MEFPSISIQIAGANIRVSSNPNGHGAIINLSADDVIKAEANTRFESVIFGNAVMDHQTGLMWAADESANTMDWDAATKYCTGWRIGDFNDWRMPTREELQTILNLNRHEPALDPIFKTNSSYVWTSTQTAWTKGNAGSSRSFWCVSMYHGHVYDDDADCQLRARPVRRASPAGQ